MYYYNIHNDNVWLLSILQQSIMLVYIIDEWSSYACIMMVSVVFLLSVQALKEIEEVGDLLLLKK